MFFFKKQIGQSLVFYNKTNNAHYKTLWFFANYAFFKNYSNSFLDLQEEGKKRDFEFFTALGSLFFLCLCKLNNNVKHNIQDYSQSCERLLFSLKNSENVIDLRIEKEKLFTLKERKPYFFYVAFRVFSSYLKKCQAFQEKLENF